MRSISLMASAVAVGLTLIGSAQAREVRTPVAPLKVEMNFLSPEAFQKTCYRGELACSQGGPGQVCQVFLRASGDLWGQTESEMAGFSNEHLIAEIAHELLHCYKGAWHPVPGKRER